MSKKITIHADLKPVYPIYMEQDFNGIASVLADLDAGRRKVCLVFDSNVAAYHQENILSLLKPCCQRLVSFVFEAGEKNKNLDTVNTLYEFLIEQQFDRKDILAAVGGGVTGDLTGYVAATYLRGIRFIQIPTSLLAMADSSIGGKTGVDFRSYKNMVGAFYQPSAVYMNFSLLKTLPEREYLSGMGEIIKHAYIQDSDMLPLLQDHAEGVRTRNFGLLEELLYRSCLVKQSVVERDPKEQRDRALLNFGHTIGHAIEKLMDFRLLHGECVALGMAAAARISCLRGMLSEDTLTEMKALLQKYGLPVVISDSVKDVHLTADAVLQTTRLDKKMDAGHVRFILLEAPGHAVIDHTVTDAELLAGIREVCI